MSPIGRARRRSSRTRARLCWGTLLGLLLWSSTSLLAQAEPQHPDACRDGAGVTVVVDFSGLGDPPAVGCAVGGGEEQTALEALSGAGFDPSGVRRWGDAFVCRIDDRPAVDERITVGDSDYREQCQDTPPPSAAWSSWQAEPEGEWRLATAGASTRVVQPGTVEGWSFGQTDAGRPAPPDLQPSELVDSAASSRELSDTASALPPEVRDPHESPAPPTGTPAPPTSTIVGIGALLVVGGVAIATWAWRRGQS